MNKIQSTVTTFSQSIRERMLVSIQGGVGEWTQNGSAPDGDKHGKESGAILEPEAFASKQDLIKETGMTPREYLLAILDAHDGRLKQQEICEHTGWPSSTVSCLLGRMDDDAEIVRIRLRREKLVFLPNAVPEAQEVAHENHRGSTFGSIKEA